MDNQTRIEKIRGDQQWLGATQENYNKKYIFDGESGKGGEAVYYRRGEPSPSQLKGMTETDEDRIRNIGSFMIIQAGMFLRLPVTTTVSSQILFHFFYRRVSFLQYDFRDAAMGAVFLATQCQETIRKSAHIALVFDQIFKIHQKSRRPTKIPDIDSREFKSIQGKVIEMSKIILIELGFETHRILDPPHRCMNSFIQLFSKHPKVEQIAQTSWGYLNDSYRTSLCLFYPGHIIAVSCIYLALRKLDLAVGTVPWWILLETSLETMEVVSAHVLRVYENRTDYHGAEQILKRCAEQHNIEDVFPVPYYRKVQNEIYLESKRLQAIEESKKREKSRERSREKEKKNKREKQGSETPQKRDTKERNRVVGEANCESGLSGNAQKAASLNEKLNEKIVEKVMRKEKESKGEMEVEQENEINVDQISQLRSKFLGNQAKNQGNNRDLGDM